MNKDYLGADIELDLDDLFKDDLTAGTPLATEDQKLDLTAAMSKRINEVKTKTEAAVREALAKDLGFNSYEELQKAKNKKIITDAGYDPEEIDALIAPLVEKRLEADPRMQRLQVLEDNERKARIASELAEIEKLTGLKVTEKDLTQDTLDVWAKGLTLTQAFIATNPSKVLGGTRGSTDHLATGQGGGGTKTRTFTPAEKAFYKSINPNITDEELNKKTVTVK